MDINAVSDFFIMIEGSSWLDKLGTFISLLTISSCLFLKVPQIKRIYINQSCEGIYPQAIVLEITSYTIMMLYSYVNGYSILTYMEYPIILAQVYVMLYLVIIYSNQLHNPIVPVGTISYFSIVFLFVIGMLPVNILCYMVPFCTPFNAFAKIAYIYGIVKAGNADAVSMTTWVISVSTNFARVVTVYLDSGDKTLIFNFVFSMCLSTSVLLTSLYYKSKTANARRAGSRVTQTRRKSRTPCKCHED